MPQHPILKRCLHLILLIYYIRSSVIAAYKVQKLIVNGVTVDIKQFPYIVQVVATSESNNLMICGGAIISIRVIVTVAHCLYDNQVMKLFPAVGVNVYAGSHKLFAGTKYAACRTMIHPKYINRQMSYFYDLGLILLSTRIKISREVQIATIANTYDWHNTKYTMTVAGYGAIGIGMPISDLTMTRLKYVDRKICEHSQTPDGYPLPVPEHIFCLVGVTTTGSCVGDSGSPVTWNNFIVGAVSHGRDYSCGSENLPVMYTDLTYFRKWIMFNTKDLESISALNCKNEIVFESLKQYGKVEDDREVYDDDCLDRQT